jgi:hypothetical protein
MMRREAAVSAMETLGNDLVLLSIRSNGVIGTAAKLPFGLSGSELVRLTALGRVDVEGDLIIIHDEASTGDALLDEALMGIREGPLSARYWVASERGDVTRRYLETLVRAGTIRTESRKALGFVAVAGWTVLDAERLAEARARLDAIAYGSGSADSGQVALAGLADAIGLPSLVYPGFAGRAARKRVATAGSRDATSTYLAGATRATTAVTIQAINAVTHATVCAATGAGHHAVGHGGHGGHASGGHH